MDIQYDSQRLVLRTLSGGLLAFGLAAALPVNAAFQTFGASLDTSIYSESPNNANGAGGVLVAGATGSNAPPSSVTIRRALMFFDLSSIASGSIVNSASLQLSVTNAAGGTTGTTPMSLFALTQDWGTGASSASSAGQGVAAVAGDATWSVRFFGSNPASPWTTAGGSFAAGALASANVGGTGTTATWSGTGLANSVQNWIDSPLTNYGWILIGNEAGSGNARQFGSSENLASGLRPLLTLDVTPVPEPSSFALVGVGLLLVVIGLRRHIP